MNENETKNLQNFIELRVREIFDNFDREFLEWNPDALARILANELSREYTIKQKWDEPKFIIVPEDERPPCCHGCDNEFGTCGTPCVNCSIMEKFSEEYDITLWALGKYRIYEKSGLS